MTDDNPSPLVKALAATDPADLIQSVSDRLEALALQHDALRLLNLDALKQATSCPCQECRDAIGEMLSNLALIERDQQKLELATDFVDSITTYDTPDISTLHKAVRTNKHCDAVSKLERTLREDG